MRTVVLLLAMACGKTESSSDASSNDGGCEGGTAGLPGSPGWSCGGTCDTDEVTLLSCSAGTWTCQIGAQPIYCACGLAGLSPQGNCCDPCADGGASVRWECNPKTREWECPAGKTMCGTGACADGS